MINLIDLLKFFLKMYQFKNIFIESEISKTVLKSILENTNIDYTKLKIYKYKKKILELKKIYKKKKEY